jgi:hypothetical protein
LRGRGYRSPSAGFIFSSVKLTIHGSRNLPSSAACSKAFWQTYLSPLGQSFVRLIMQIATRVYEFSAPLSFKIPTTPQGSENSSSLQPLYPRHVATIHTHKVDPANTYLANIVFLFSLPSCPSGPTRLLRDYPVTVSPPAELEPQIYGNRSRNRV